MNTELLIQLLVNGLIVGTLYGVVAMSFVLIYKATQVVNFAQGEFLLIGAWVCWWLLTKYQLPFYLGMPITLVFMLVFGIALQVCRAAPDDRRADHLGDHGDDRALDGLPGGDEMDLRHQPAAVPADLRLAEREHARAAGADRLPDEPRGVGGDDGWMAWFFQSSKHGLAMRATAFDQQVAQSLGISVKSVFAMAWAISAVVSAVAGVVVAVVNGVSAGLSVYGIKVFPAVILGGLDSIVGAVLGGIIIGLLEEPGAFRRQPVPALGQPVRDRAILRPHHHPDDQAYGLFGTNDIERV